MKRAYLELEREGVIVTQQGRGSRAADTYVMYAHSVALLVEQAAERRDYTPPPDDPHRIAAEIRERFERVGFAGLLDYSGRFKKPEDVPDHPLHDRLIDVDGMRAFVLADGVYLTQRDIRELQFAKGSIATGIKVLMDILGVTAKDLDEVLLGGSFGSYLNPESAKIIGLVPPVDVDRIIAVGNSAGEGAKIALLSYRERQVAFELPSRIEYVELSGRSDFNDSFVSVLQFPELETLR